MLPLFKLFSLFVRILARPVIARTKAHTASKLNDQNLRKFFIWIGTKAHRVNVVINRKFLKLNSQDFKIQDLTENAALELGVETFYEVIIYACILGLPIIEIYRNHIESTEKSEKQKELMSSIETRLQKLDTKNHEQSKQIQQLTCINNILFQKSNVLEQVLATQKILKKDNEISKQIEELNQSLSQSILEFALIGQQTEQQQQQEQQQA